VRKGWISKDDLDLSINEQLMLSSICKGSYYYTPIPETAENLLYMEQIDNPSCV
jgi:hypothetical protein